MDLKQTVVIIGIDTEQNKTAEATRQSMSKNRAATDLDDVQLLGAVAGRQRLVVVVTSINNQNRG